MPPTSGTRPDLTTRETEAEAVAYLLCAQFGIAGTEASVACIQSYRGTSETLDASLERIRATAVRLAAEFDFVRTWQSTACEQLASGAQPAAQGQWAMPTDFIGLFALLAAARVRFVLVGGLALVLHGLDRLTADVDLVIDLTAESAKAAVEALTAVGYRPLAPVDPMALADLEQRREWQSTRNMQVFSFWDSSNTRPTVDIMLSPEVPFDELWTAAATMIIGGHEVRVASIEHLIRMKTAAGRPQDLADIERLRTILKS